MKQCAGEFVSFAVVFLTGAVKAKGGYVMKLNDLSYDLPIINKALVDYMIKGIPVEQRQVL